MLMAALMMHYGSTTADGEHSVNVLVHRPHAHHATVCEVLLASSEVVCMTTGPSFLGLLGILLLALLFLMTMTPRSIRGGSRKGWWFNRCSLQGMQFRLDSGVPVEESYAGGAESTYVLMKVGCGACIATMDLSVSHAGSAAAMATTV